MYSGNSPFWLPWPKPTRKDRILGRIQLAVILIILGLMGYVFGRGAGLLWTEAGLPTSISVEVE